MNGRAGEKVTMELHHIPSAGLLNYRSSWRKMGDGRWRRSQAASLCFYAFEGHMKTREVVQ